MLLGSVGDGASGDLVLNSRAPDSEAFRRACRDVFRQTGRGQNSDPQLVVPRLVSLYNAAAHVEGLSHATRKRLRNGLTNRMRRMRTRLAQRVRATPRGRRASTFGGPAEQRSARQLIELIQETISPSSWDVNGGSSSVIRFYSPLNVLVIRASTRNHHEIGNVLGQVRR